MGPVNDDSEFKTLALDLGEPGFQNECAEILDGYWRGFYSLDEAKFRIEGARVVWKKRADQMAYNHLNACDCGCYDGEGDPICTLDDPCRECAGCSERAVCEAEDRFEEGA